MAAGLRSKKAEKIVNKILDRKLPKAKKPKTDSPTRVKTN